MSIQRRTRHLSLRHLAFLALLIITGSAVAMAAPPARVSTASDKAAAVKLLDEGNRAFSTGDATLALRHFRAAYDRFPSPKIWFNIAEAHRALGQIAEAIDAYTRFIDTVGTTVPAQRVADARARVTELRAEQARTTPPAAERAPVARVEERPPVHPTAPAPTAAPAEPTTSSPALARSSSPVEHTVTERRAQTKSVWRSPLVLSGYAVTGALLLALAGTGGATLTYNDRYQDGTRSVADRQSARDTGTRLAWVSDGLLIGAIVVAVGTTTYAVVRHVRR